MLLLASPWRLVFTLPEGVYLGSFYMANFPTCNEVIKLPANELFPRKLALFWAKMV